MAPTVEHAPERQARPLLPRLLDNNVDLTGALPATWSALTQLTFL
jgi:hypothetical protein